MSLLWQLLDCARWGGGQGGSPQIRVRTSRVDYVKRVNASRGWQRRVGQANFYCQDHTATTTTTVGPTKEAKKQLETD